MQQYLNAPPPLFKQIKLDIFTFVLSFISVCCLPLSAWLYAWHYCGGVEWQSLALYSLVLILQGVTSILQGMSPFALQEQRIVTFYWNTLPFTHFCHFNVSQRFFHHPEFVFSPKQVQNCMCKVTDKRSFTQLACSGSMA